MWVCDVAQNDSYLRHFVFGIREPIIFRIMNTNPRYIFAVLLVTILAFISAHATQAQEEDAVRATIEAHYTAIHAGDMSTVWGHHLSDFTFFEENGRPLRHIASEANMGASLDFGEVNVFMSHFNAQIYGDVAVATFYLVGTITNGDNVKNGTWRVSAVWVKEGNEWKEAHHHESPLMGKIHP
jgi:ketosteroid isomerase-like protein